MMKRAISIAALLLAALLTLTACGSTAQSDISLADVYGEVKANVSLADDFKDYKSLDRDFGITDEMIEEFAGGHSTSGVNQETIVIVKAKDAESAEQVFEKLSGYREQKLSENKNYNAEQYAIIEKSHVVQKGDYLTLVISEDAGEIEKIIDGHIA